MPRDSELVATERLRNIQLTGDIEIDAVANLKNMLARELVKDEFFKMSAIEIYDVEPDNLPRLPAICLILTGSETRQRTMGKENATFIRNITVDLVYYHADINEKASEVKMRLNMSRITSVINRNRDLNGYCRIGATTGATSFSRTGFDGNKLINTAVTPIFIPIMYRGPAAGQRL